MKKIVRSNAFETNSSSCHSLSVNFKSLIKRVENKVEFDISKPKITKLDINNQKIQVVTLNGWQCFGNNLNSSQEVFNNVESRLNCILRLPEFINMAKELDYSKHAQILKRLMIKTNANAIMIDELLSEDGFDTNGIYISKEVINNIYQKHPFIDLSKDKKSIAEQLVSISQMIGTHYLWDKDWIMDGNEDFIIDDFHHKLKSLQNLFTEELDTNQLYEEFIYSGAFDYYTGYSSYYPSFDFDKDELKNQWISLNIIKQSFDKDIGCECKDYIPINSVVHFFELITNLLLYPFDKRAKISFSNNAKHGNDETKFNLNLSENMLSNSIVFLNHPYIADLEIDTLNQDEIILYQEVFNFIDMSLCKASANMQSIEEFNDFLTTSNLKINSFLSYINELDFVDNDKELMIKMFNSILFIIKYIFEAHLNQKVIVLDNVDYKSLNQLLLD